jgi:transcription factor 1
VKAINKKGREGDHRVDMMTQVNKLTVKDWKVVLEAFNEWPFAPQVRDFN